MSNTPKSRLEEIESRLKAATLGPWKFVPVGDYAACVSDLTYLIARVRGLEDALRLTNVQNRTRGYPTGAEWELLCNLHAQALTGQKDE